MQFHIMRNYKILAVLLFSVISFFGNAQGEDQLNLDKNIALQSYDIVSYFILDTPLKGKEEFQAKQNGATYYFANAKNKETFLNNPTNYPVVYGGWCAYAMGKSGKKIPIDPLTYKIIDGELYLFYNKYLTNTLEKWNEDEKSLHQKADENWLEIIKQK